MKIHGESLSSLLSRGEDLQLEFKSAQAIEDPQILPRAVCSLLNAKGGVVLVGVRDDGSLEGVVDAAASCSRVEDRLASTIRPRAHWEVRVEKAPNGVDLLRVRVPKSDRLHAVASTQGRFLVPRRSGARTVNLDWIEIVSEVRSEASGDDGQELRRGIERSLVGWRKTCEATTTAYKSEGGIFVVIDVQGTEVPPGIGNRLEEAHENPARLTLTADSMLFRDPRGVTHRKDGFGVSGDPGEGFRHLEVSLRDPLRLRFANRLDAGWNWGMTWGEVERSKLLDPNRVCLVVLGLVRLTRHLLGSPAEERAGKVSIGVEMIGLRERRLPRGAPGVYGYLNVDPPPVVVGDPGPIFVLADTSEVLAADDRVAKRVLDALYAAFGLDERFVPFYDQESRRFRFGR